MWCHCTAIASWLGGRNLPALFADDVESFAERILPALASVTCPPRASQPGSAPGGGGVCTRIGFYEKNKKNKSLLNLQTEGGWGAWFLFARAFMGRECAHLIRARRLLCFRLAFALAYAGLCENISLCWLELWSMPHHRYTASELIPHRLQGEKPNATATKKKQCLWTDRPAECLAPRSCRLSFATPPSCSAGLLLPPLHPLPVYFCS